MNTTTPKLSWYELCEMAAKEQDPKKLMEPVQEISRLLDEKYASAGAAQGTAVGKNGRAA